MSLPSPWGEGLGVGLFIVATFTVLVNIQSFLLDTLIATKAVGIFDGVEHNHTNHKGEYGNRHCTKCLNANAALYAINSAIAEDTGQNGTQQTAYAVNADGTNGIVNLQHLIYKGYAETHHYADNETNEGGTADAHAVATCRDTYKTCQNAVTNH